MPLKLTERDQELLAGRHGPASQLAMRIVTRMAEVYGARTNRYGDYMDIAAALTGRVPKSGLHLTEQRHGQVLLQLEGVPEPLLRDDSLFPVLGYLAGLLAGERIPVIAGLLPTTTEDQLKAIGAASASAGAVAMFHAVGVTPEAPTLAAAFGGRDPEEVHRLGMA